jgi:hypothetical protein
MVDPAVRIGSPQAALVGDRHPEPPARLLRNLHLERSAWLS